MIGKWGICIFLIGLLVLAVGCRSTQPTLKPPEEPQRLVLPPSEARYNSSEYPKQALSTPEDPTKRLTFDPKGAGGMGRNSMMPGGMGGRGGQ